MRNIAHALLVPNLYLLGLLEGHSHSDTLVQCEGRNVCNFPLSREHVQVIRNCDRPVEKITGKIGCISIALLKLHSGGQCGRV